MSLGTVLVTGGCGFVGFHIVRELLRQSCSVHVISRNPTVNCITGATYHTGDVNSVETMQTLLLKIQPNVIFHVASPIAGLNTQAESIFYQTIVRGTQNLLQYAQSSPSVKAFVYTSSVTVMAASAGSSFVDLTEDAPRLTRSSRADPYARTKAIADAIVLAANNPDLRTVSIRLVSVYGERDNQMIPGVLDVLRQGRQRYQLGDNQNLYDTVSATNAAAAHILAAKALLAGITNPAGPKVEGEAFFITDGAPEFFWTFLRQVWTAAGDNTSLDQVTAIPTWLLLPFTSALEWAYRICTLGYKRPTTLRRGTMEWVCLSRTFSIEKARKLLGYVPVNDRAEMIAKAVDREREK
jgi:sterol-4alpha-carboxylate 3-dehydrogenase (decarboxylating)